MDSREVTSGNPKKTITKRKKWSRKGVSDIIGNLLILAITVTLFSSIIWYVSSMPTPTSNVYGDFSATIDYKTGQYANITIKNLGGESLLNHRTNIYLITNESHVSLKINDSRPSIGDTWYLGSTWIYNTTTNAVLLNLNSTTNLEAMIVDTDRNVIVWRTVLLDGSAATSTPVILDRYLAQFVSEDIWIRSSTFSTGQNVALFVNVIDAGNDIDCVYADVSNLGYPANLTLSDTNNDGWYSNYFPIGTVDTGQKYITINAYDNGGRHTTSTLAVTVYNTTNDSNDDNGGGGGTGSPPGKLYFSNLQGIALFKYDDWFSINYSADPTTKFKYTEKAVAVVASKFLVNTDNINEMYILDQSKKIVATVSSPNFVFHSWDYYSGYYVYYAVIDIPELPSDNSNYICQVQLRDTWLPDNNVFFATLGFEVGNPITPTIQTYSDPACTHQTDNFTSSAMVYVKITGAPTIGSWNQYAGLVELADYFWNMELKSVPGTSGSPVSTLVPSSGNTVYTFKINLSAANQDPWLPGNNAYMLRYDVFQVGTSQFMLSKMLNVTAPRIILDMVAGTNTVKGGWASGSLIDYYKNNNQWVPPDFIQAWDNKHQATYDAAKLVKIANINNNGRYDVVGVVVSGSTNLIVIYANDGAWTPTMVEATGRGTITSLDVGTVDISGGDDIIVGYSTGEVGYYRNDGLWTYVSVGTATNSAVTVVKAIDAKNTEATYGTAQSMDIVAGYSSSSSASYPIHIFKNLNNLGTSWQDIAWKGQVANVFSTNTNWETGVAQYLAHGNANSTALGSGNYEELFEVNTTTSINAQTNVLTVDNGGSADFTVASGGSYSWNDWSRWLSNIVPTDNITSVRLDVSYFNTLAFKTTGSPKDTNSIVNVYHNGSGVSIANAVLGYAASSTVVQIPITGVTNLNDLATLRVTFNNNQIGSGSAFVFHYWRIYVTYTAQATVLNHVWRFTTTQFGTNTVDLDAMISGSGTTTDGIRLQYSTAINGPYNDFPLDIVITSTSYAHYSGVLPTTLAATTFYIKAYDLNPLDNYLTNTSLSVKNFVVNTTTYTFGSIGLPVKDIQLCDMDLDGWVDLVVADNQRVWINYNDKHGSLTAALPIDATTAAITSGIVNIGAGVISSSSTHPGLIIADANGHIWTVTPNSVGSFVNAPVDKFAVSGLLKMVAGDVDGDGDLDFVVSTSSNYLILYRNDGSGSFSGATIDVLGASINDVSLGKIQNF